MIDFNKRFKIVIKHKDCGEICGLVKGGLSRKPRIICFKHNEMLSVERNEIDIEIFEVID